MLSVVGRSVVKARASIKPRVHRQGSFLRKGAFVQWYAFHGPIRSVFIRYAESVTRSAEVTAARELSFAGIRTTSRPSLPEIVGRIAYIFWLCLQSGWHVSHWFSELK